MNSPFSDFMEMASETVSVPLTELELQSPFVDRSESFETEFSSTEAYPADEAISENEITLSNKHRINVQKAVAANNIYEKKIWGSEKANVYIYLFNNKVIRFPLPLNSEQLAYAVADFQALKGLTVDGMLGPTTWSLLKTAVAVTNPQPVSTIRSKWHNVIPDAVLSPAKPLVDGINAFSRSLMRFDLQEKGILFISWDGCSTSILL